MSATFLFSSQLPPRWVLLLTGSIKPRDIRKNQMGWVDEFIIPLSFFNPSKYMQMCFVACANVCMFSGHIWITQAIACLKLCILKNYQKMIYYKHRVLNEGQCVESLLLRFLQFCQPTCSASHRIPSWCLTAIRSCCGKKSRLSADVWVTQICLNDVKIKTV